MNWKIYRNDGNLVMMKNNNEVSSQITTQSGYILIYIFSWVLSVDHIIQVLAAFQHLVEYSACTICFIQVRFSMAAMDKGTNIAIFLHDKIIYFPKEEGNFYCFALDNMVLRPWKIFQALTWGDYEQSNSMGRMQIHIWIRLYYIEDWLIQLALRTYNKSVYYVG